jgi:ethanolamine ammonia-lyase small subunit
MTDPGHSNFPKVISANDESVGPWGLSPSLRSFTSARIGLSRTGSSLSTSEVLDFQLAHARARDAVHARLQPNNLLNSLREFSALSEAFDLIPGPVLLRSAAPDRRTYLQRPDLGRRLSPASVEELNSTGSRFAYDLVIAFCDGLSALALERHAVPLLREIFPILRQRLPGIRISPICIVEQARVAVGDEIAQLLGARLALILIGERPGLSSPDSLGAYLTWKPQPGITTDAERNCVSNIRPEGLSYSQAAIRLSYLIQQAWNREQTGVALKDQDAVTDLLSEPADRQP